MAAPTAGDAAVVSKLPAAALTNSGLAVTVFAPLATVCAAIIKDVVVPHRAGAVVNVFGLTAGLGVHDVVFDNRVRRDKGGDFVQY